MAARMEDIVVYDLSALGFGPFFERQLPPPGDGGIPARIAAEHRGGYEVWSATGAGRARLGGRLRLDSDDERPGVGDWILVREAPSPGRTTVVERVLDRRTVFTRGAAGSETRVQVVAANVDLVFVVCGLDVDFNVHRIERYLARVWAGGARPCVILNKADACADPGARIAEVEQRAADVPILAVSALRSDGVDSVRACVEPGMTVALAGSSGVGKSTLVNALVGEERMRTGEVRAATAGAAMSRRAASSCSCPAAACCSTRRGCASCSFRARAGSTPPSATSPRSPDAAASATAATTRSPAAR